MTTVVRISRLGGPSAAEPAMPHAALHRGAASAVRLLPLLLLAGTDVTAVRELYARVSGAREPVSVGPAAGLLVGRPGPYRSTPTSAHGRGPPVWCRSATRRASSERFRKARETR